MRNNLLILFKYAAIAGNVVFCLWVMFNAIDDGFRGTLAEKVSGIGLIMLLALNCYLLLNNHRPSKLTNQ